MHLKTAAATFAVAAFGLLAAAGTASAQRPEPRDPPRSQRRDDFGFDRIHRAARAIEKNAHDLHEEVDEHFRRSPAYRHLHEHTRDIERLARDIHQITDGRDSRRRLLRAVDKLDDEVHHFVEVVEESKHFRNIPERAYAHLRKEVTELHRAATALKRMLD